VSAADILAEPKIDSHVHVLDPARFPYNPNTHYAPAGQELGTPAQLLQVMETYGTRHALLVGPNSGYGLDNRCMLDTIARGGGRFKGIAVVRNDISHDELAALKAQGVIGVAWNVTFYGVDYYKDAAPLVDKLVDLDMFVDIQVEHAQLLAFVPLLEKNNVRILVDHAGRPTVEEGVQQRGFRALLELAATRRAYVKLSGLVKYSREPSPHDDVRPFLDALREAYTLDHCLWASDWPYLRAPSRVDYGVQLGAAQRLFPDARERRAFMHDNAKRLFGF
jgi:predicted TIM-barrel fold metal-dependent hydrolase